VSGWSRSCRASVAIRSSRVEMGNEPDVSSIFPSPGSMSRRALRSTGSLRTGSPASSLLRRAPTSRRPAPAHLRLRFAVPSRRRSERDLPSSSATLATRAPALRPRQTLRSRTSGTGRPYVSLLRYGLPCLPSRRLPPLLSFRGPIPQPACSLSTLRGPGYPRTTQDSLPAGGPALAGWGLNPLGRSTRFQLMRAYMASSLSRLSWRTVDRERAARRSSHLVRPFRLA
jgi:hypothetical protein